MSDQPCTEERFKIVIIDMAQLIRKIVVYVNSKGYKTKLTPQTIDLGTVALNGFSGKKLTHEFVKRSYKIAPGCETDTYWDKAREKNEDFLHQNLSILFGELSMDLVQDFSDIMKLKDDKGKYVVVDETRESIWEFLQALIKISIRFVHETRKPELIDGKKQYTVEYFSEISVSKQVTLWKIKSI